MEPCKNIMIERVGSFREKENCSDGAGFYKDIDV